MGIPIWDSIVGPVVDKVLSFIPDPKQRAEAKAAAMQAAMDGDKAFREFVVEYEGAAKDVHPALQIYRGSVRPTITYALAGTFIYGFVNPDIFNKDTMTLLFQLNLLSMSFWYGEKALRGIGLDLTRLGKKK